ncbi:MAG: class I SAM-dependent methyltransferase, partial [Nisaea sp.]|uniref:class I SAM-dependent methyltransferase n=1 Tax=Nisaea sp. TaxID=2024842 RepID=UPI00326766BD
AVDGPAADGPEAPLFQRLIALYQAQGFDVMVGIENRNHDLRKDTELATLFTGDPAAPEYCDIGQGIAVTELYFFECLARVFQPRNILIIGSAFGWSTLGLGLIFPGARVVALDNLSLGGEVAMGIDLTRRIARDAGLNVTVVEGASPGDVAGAVNDHLDGPVDLAFIDGLDTEVQQALDFAAVRDVLATSSVIAFHHVLLLNLLSGFRAIQQDWQGGGGLMTRTPSGMGCLYSAVLERTVGTVVSAFTDPTIDVPVPK